MKIAFIISHSFDLAQALLFCETADYEIDFQIIILAHQYTNNLELSELPVPAPILDLRSKNTNLIWQTKKNVKKILKFTRNADYVFYFNKFDWTLRLLSQQKNFFCLSQERENVHEKLNKDVLRTLKQNAIEFLLGLKFSKIFTDPENTNIRNIILADLRNEILLVNKSTDIDKGKIKFPLPKFHLNEKKSKKCILVFGGRFRFWKYVHSDVVKNKYKEIMDLLESKYKEAKFVYLKHPLEKDEFNYLDDDRLELYQGSLNAELMMIKNQYSVVHSISFGSTASVSAYNYGIQSTVFYDECILDDEVKKVYDQIFEGTDPAIKSIGGAKSGAHTGGTISELIKVAEILRSKNAGVIVEI